MNTLQSLFWNRATLATVTWLLASSAGAQNRAAELETPTVEVVATTPLPGIGTPVREVPANVQVRTSAEIGRQNPLSIADFADQNLVGVNVNESQSNPFQPDVNFRGFSASPLLGTPQGISVFVDGVRVNEAFGDSINWDLIPAAAISSINLVPGSNPVFGLNTLGGALSILTKSGKQHPGGGIEALAGIFKRRAAEFEYGLASGDKDFYIAGNLLEEDGWRVHSPSDVRTLFTKVGIEDERTDLDLSAVVADNALEGIQALPGSLISNLRQAYTFPDRTTNKLTFLNLKASRFTSESVLIAGNAYWRDYRSANFSSNVNDQVDDTMPIGATNPEGINDASTTDQRSMGASFQITFLGAGADSSNQLTLGISGDFGRTKFKQHEQAAVFSADRGTIALNAFQLETDVLASNNYLGVFLTDIYRFSQSISVTGAGRFNQARVSIEDQSGNDPALNGAHKFSKFNPALGVTYNPDPAFNAYLSANQGMRAPTPIELTCASPTDPCRLPNAFLADPPLKPVISRTVEAGVRGRMSKNSQWSLTAYHTALDDDIQFVSSGGAINAGFFQNVGKTRRRGFEAATEFSIGGLKLAASYSQINASFESAFAINSPNNSSADGSGEIRVTPGDRIPGIPKHSFKLLAQYEPSPRITLGANLTAYSKQFARGNENNEHQAGTFAGSTFSGRGEAPGYTIINLTGQWRLAKNWQIFGRINNLFDKRHFNAAILGENAFANGVFDPDSDNWLKETFFAPGAPRAAWVGVRYEFDPPPGE